MNHLEQAKDILCQLEVSEKQQSKICQITLLALANVDKETSWQSAENPWLRIHDILVFTNEKYGEKYAENSRETFRKQALHHFRNAAFIEDNGVATNSGKYAYILTNEMKDLLCFYDTPSWSDKLAEFKSKHKSLIQLYSSQNQRKKIAFSVNGQDLEFSPGKHNELQKAVIEEFLPRFAPGSLVLYVGDTENKNLVRENTWMETLGLELGYHEKLPDIILYQPDHEWLYFIECVTSTGPMSPQRIQEVNGLAFKSTAGKIYVTAFPDFKTYKKFIDSIAWETEIWLADNPDHMIHMNGDKFLGPRHFE